MVTPSSIDETHLRSLVRSILLEDGFLKRDDSEQTIENSLQPIIPSPSVDPFTAHWYATLIPHKTRDPFKAPETKPRFFNVRDAQHTALFNPNSAAGGCQEADLLYQAIAFLHRAMDDLIPLIDAQELVDVWKSLKGVTEMLHTRYDLICALRRSRDDQHIRYLEMFMQPPSGDGAASARIHREICRAVSKKRPREGTEDTVEPLQARPKTSVDMEPMEDAQVATVPPVKTTDSPKSKTPSTKDIKDVKAKSRPSPTQKGASRSKTVIDAPKLKRATPVKTNCSSMLSRTRSGAVSKRLRSNSTSRDKPAASGTKAEKPAPTSKNKESTSLKKVTPKKQPSNSKKALSTKKVESEKKFTPNKSGTVDTKVTPRKQRSSNYTEPSTSGFSKRASRGKKGTPNKKGMSSEDDALGNPFGPLKSVSSIKKGNPQNRAPSKNQLSSDNTEKKAEEKTKQDNNVTLDPQVHGERDSDIEIDEEVEVVHVKLSKKEKSNAEKTTSANSIALTKDSEDIVKPSAEQPMTNFTFVTRADSNEEMKSPLHTYVGYQWRLIVYPHGDNHKGWMSVYLECQGPTPSEIGNFEAEMPFATEAGGTDSDQAWFIRVKFSVRVLRTDSSVTKAVLEGKDVAVDNDREMLSASKVDPDGKVAQTGLLSDFIGVISHDFSPLSDRVGFSRLVPATCLNPGMYADDAKNIALMLFMCAE